MDNDTKKQKLQQINYLSYFKDRFDDYREFMVYVKSNNNQKYLDLTFKEFVELSVLVGNSLVVDEELYIN